MHGRGRGPFGSGPGCSKTGRLLDPEMTACLSIDKRTAAHVHHQAPAVGTAAPTAGARRGGPREPRSSGGQSRRSTSSRPSAGDEEAS